MKNLIRFIWWVGLLLFFIAAVSSCEKEQDCPDPRPYGLYTDQYRTTWEFAKGVFSITYERPADFPIIEHYNSTEIDCVITATRTARIDFLCVPVDMYPSNVSIE